MPSLPLSIWWHWRCASLPARNGASRPPPSVSGVPLWLLGVSLFTFVLGLLQWLRMDYLGVMLADLPSGARPAGNIAQANHFATLMVWGVIGVWLLYENRQMRGATAWVPASCLLFGIVMSQSRTGWVNVTLLVIVAFLLRRRGLSRLPMPAAVLLAGGFAGLVALWTPLNQALHFAPALTVEQLAQGGSRLNIWRLSVAAIAEQPWFGYGWTQVGLAQHAVSLSEPAVNVVFSDAHNLVLDLMLWNGVPVGISILLGLALWLLRRAAAVRSAEAALYLLMLLVVLIHAQFEFPLSYTYFLLPAGLVAGFLEADTAVSEIHDPPLGLVEWHFRFGRAACRYHGRVPGDPAKSHAAPR